MFILTHLKFRAMFLVFGVLLLCNLASSQWTKRLKHRDFPAHEIKLKQPKLCDNVTQHSGYLDVSNTKHLFFWFFESRNNPGQDPLVLWLNGGPGCSSTNSLYYEMGPCTVDKGGNSTTPNPYSWNNKASIIFLDQPINTGYSYGDDVSNTSAAMADAYAFLLIFFQNFPEYAKLKFHIAGESYGGHYIPVLASTIRNGATKINLESILIGSGLVDPRVQFPFFPDIACKPPYGPVLNNSACNQMIADIPQCTNATRICYNSGSATDCYSAYTVCSRTMLDPILAIGRNTLDIRQTCSGIACYPDFLDILKYSNSTAVKAQLGVDPSFNFQLCNTKINDTFVKSGDWMLPFDNYIPSLLDNGIRALIYTGDADYLCNWLGNYAWTRTLQWSGAAGFNSTNPAQWITSAGVYSGNYTTFGVLTFLKVFGASHMVPHDQPEASLDFFTKWISNQPL